MPCFSSFTRNVCSLYQSSPSWYGQILTSRQTLAALPPRFKVQAWSLEPLTKGAYHVHHPGVLLSPWSYWPLKEYMPWVLQLPTGAYHRPWATRTTASTLAVVMVIPKVVFQKALSSLASVNKRILLLQHHDAVQILIHVQEILATLLCTIPKSKLECCALDERGLPPKKINNL